MSKKGPKTEKGKVRKFWTGDGRRRTPMEELTKSMEEASKALKKALDGTTRKGTKKRKKK